MKQTQQKFYVRGMTCTTCARTVEKVLTRMDGVDFASVSLPTETAVVVSRKPIDFAAIEHAVSRAGYGASLTGDASVDTKRHHALQRELLLCLALTIPLSVAMILHMAGLHIPYYIYFELIAGGLVLFLSGWRVFMGAWIALIHFHANMDSLISLGSLSAWLTAILRLSGLPIHSFAAIGPMIIAIHLAGRYLESRLRQRATQEVRALMGLKQQQARLLNGDSTILVPVEAVKQSDRVRVRPGERIPVDGIITAGTSAVDASMVTGESMPMAKQAGDRVIGGSLNLHGLLTVQAEKVGEDSFLNQMIRLIQDAQGGKIPIQALADRITRWFVPVIVLLAVTAGITWYFGFDRLYPTLAPIRAALGNPGYADALSMALFAFVATLVISCPCALGLAIPMALLAGTSLAARTGLLFRRADVMQNAKDTEVVIMDKTGTLTQGKPTVVSAHVPEQYKNRLALLEQQSNHPLAQAVIAYTGAAEPENLENFKELPGQGVQARIGADTLFVGKPLNPKDYSEQMAQGQSVVELRVNGECAGWLIVADTLRPDSAKAVVELKKMGITPLLATGDNETAAQYMASQAGGMPVRASLTPADKLALIRDYQAQGKTVLMAGDGMNDAAALKGADIGVAVAGGTDLAIDSADVVIVHGGLGRLLDVVRISRRTFRAIRQNLFWAFFYNMLAIPAAMAGLLHPLIAEIAMAISSVTVMLNSARISRKKEKEVPMTRYTLSVPDMSCMHCVKRIDKMLSQAGLSDFTIDLEQKEVRVTINDIGKVLGILTENDYPAKIIHTV